MYSEIRPPMNLVNMKVFQKSPIHWDSYSSPSKFHKTKVLFLSTLAILNGPNYILSNFSCFFLLSFLSSHLNTISPIRKVSSLFHLSKLTFTLCLYACAFLSQHFPFLMYLNQLIYLSMDFIRFFQDILHKFMIGKPS